MMLHLLKIWTALRSSYWFIPMLMSIVAAVLSVALTHIDMALGNAWIADVPWVYAIQADGARGLLTTVAGSMIGVAGVTFSITIAALSYTTVTLGPRLLTNFMDDTGNQVTLGTFVATFVYCLLLLRTVQGDIAGHSAFVPYLALVFAMGLTIASLAALIYFFHHITESLHVSNVVGDVARDLDVALKRHTQAVEANRERPLAYLPADFSDTAVPVRAPCHGYIQNLLYNSLVKQATAHDLILRQARGPGDFAAAGQVLLWAWPPSRVDDELTTQLAGSYAFGRQRTRAQDILFLVNELVEIAARALSPGTNDPYTAMSCLDWLAAALIRLTGVEPAPAHHFDDDQRLRLWVPEFGFKTLALAVFEPLRPYFAGDRNAALHMLDTIGEIGDFVGNSGHRQLLRAQADAVREGALAAVATERDRGAVKQAHRRTCRRLNRRVE